jgi:hypothetical protein
MGGPCSNALCVNWPMLGMLTWLCVSTWPILSVPTWLCVSTWLNTVCLDGYVGLSQGTCVHPQLEHSQFMPLCLFVMHVLAFSEAFGLLAVHRAASSPKACMVVCAEDASCILFWCRRPVCMLPWLCDRQELQCCPCALQLWTRKGLPLASKVCPLAEWSHIAVGQLSHCCGPVVGKQVPPSICLGCLLLYACCN